MDNVYLGKEFIYLQLIVEKFVTTNKKGIKIMVSKLIKSLLVLAFILFSSGVFAQDDSPPCPKQPCQGPSTPIDGGIAVLIAIGIGYGIKKVRDLEK